MNAWIEKVREFHEKYGVVLDDKISTWSCADEGSKDVLMLFRIRLITEEVSEFIKACSDNANAVEMADALGDLLYVTIGAAVTFGFNIEAVFDEIHKSNMSKSNRVESDGKVVKGEDWIPPNIEGVM